MLLRRLVFVLVGFVVLGAPAGAWAAGACPNEALREAQYSTALPDCRAYELVSPPDKGGTDVIQQTSKTHVATDGNGVTFSALGGFGALQATSFDSEYVSHRTGVAGTNGWSTHGINPPGRSITLLALFGGNAATYVDAFTPDLSAAVYRSLRTDAPNVGEVSNFYRIGGLGGASESAQLLTAGVAPLPAWPTVTKGLIRPWLVGASTDLSHVVFESQLALTADATPYQGLFCVEYGFCPTQLYENANGVVRLVGRIPTGAETSCDDVNGPACVSAASSQAGISAALGGTGGAYSSQRMVSRDGRRILFQVPAGVESGAIYVREDGVRTSQIAQDGTLWAASTDGSRAFFVTSDSLVPGDTDTSPDLYMYDASAPANNRLTLVSVSTTANHGNVGTVIGASDDGRYVYFGSDGQLVAGQPPLVINGLYVWHDGTLAFIGQLSNVVVAERNGPRSGEATARVSPDGRHLMFMEENDAGFRGRGGFTGYEQAGHSELYLYSADTGRLVCASCNPSGKAATAHAVTDVRQGVGVSFRTTKLSHALSDDGRYVFFSSADALVPGDTNGSSDAYEYDSLTGRVSLLSSGTDPADSYFIDASDDGANVFFVTRARLVGWDVDGSFDLYDARVGGGFPEPAQASSGCVGDGCQGGVGSAPAFGSPGSAGFAGAGNLKPAVGGATTRKSPSVDALRLSRALRACKRRHGAQRKRCEASARRRFGKASRAGRGK